MEYIDSHHAETQIIRLALYYWFRRCWPETKSALGLRSCPLWGAVFSGDHELDQFVALRIRV